MRSFGSIFGQNLFLFLIFVALQPESAEFFLAILAFVLLLPLSGDPMQKIPAERRALWPVSQRQWRAIRIGSFALSPISWAALVLLFRTGWRAGGLLVGCAAILLIATQAAKRIHIQPLWKTRLRIPAPSGTMGALMRLHWREMLRTLDPYVALLLTLCALLYRFSGKPLDPAAPRILSLVVVLALSTEAQVLLGIDGSGAERYRQMPIRGWQILLAKDLAFLVLTALLVAPLQVGSGLTAAVAVLAIGHYRSVTTPIPQLRWRFTSGVLFPDGVMQIAALFAAGNAVATLGWRIIVPCIAAWALSIWLYGRAWDRQNGS